MVRVVTRVADQATLGHVKRRIVAMHQHKRIVRRIHADRMGQQFDPHQITPPGIYLSPQDVRLYVDQLAGRCFGLLFLGRGGRGRARCNRRSIRHIIPCRCGRASVGGGDILAVLLRPLTELAFHLELDPRLPDHHQDEAQGAKQHQSSKVHQGRIRS